MENQPPSERQIELEDEKRIGLTEEDKINYRIERGEDLAMQTKAMQEHIQALTAINGIDHLTGAYNRMEFDERLTKALEVIQEGGGRKSDESLNVVSLVMIDIDHFKAVNDSLGHSAGDEVLAKVANVLRRSVRKEDVVARYGGEEFFVLLYNLDVHQAAQKAEEMRAAVEGLTFEKYLDTRVTASFGVASSDQELDAETLKKKADDAMYESKNNGRNRVSIATVE